MAQRRPGQLTSDAHDEQLELAQQRATLPHGQLWLDYQPDADLLFVGFVEHPGATRTTADYERGLIYHYNDKGQQVGVEILDLYGVFAN